MTNTANSYSVHCFVSVRVKLSNIPATGYREAIRQAIERFDWDQLRHDAEFTDEFLDFLVDVAGDDEFLLSKWFNADLEETSSGSQSATTESTANRKD